MVLEIGSVTLADYYPAALKKGYYLQDVRRIASLLLLATGTDILNNPA